MDIEWRCSGIDEVGIDRNSGREIVRIDPRYFRPTEVDTLLGDPTKAKNELGWEVKTSFPDLVKEMIAGGLKEAKKDAIMKEAAFQTFDYHE